MFTGIREGTMVIMSKNDYNYNLGLTQLMVIIVLMGMVALGALVMFTSVFV